MALATQCPHCQTTFRVAHDQLKLRAGLVRCGACKEIFNGIEHLLRSEDIPVIPVVPAPLDPLLAMQSAPHIDVLGPTLPLTEPINSSIASAETRTEANYPAVFFDAPQANLAIDQTLPPSPVEPLERMTLMHFSDDTAHSASATSASTDDESALEESVSIEDAANKTKLTAETSATAGALVHRSTHESADELDQAIDYLQRKPWRGSKKSLSREDIEGPPSIDNDDDYPLQANEPEFIARSRNAQQRRSALRTLMFGAVALLIFGAAAQSVYVLRDELAARLPASRPALESICQLFGCRIGLPAQIDAVSIESNELVALPSSKNNYALNLLLRNRSSLSQSWPAIELTLLDGSDRPLVRRVFNPREYLPASIDTNRGFAPNTEQSAKITFELLQQKAANYRVYLFYP